MAATPQLAFSSSAQNPLALWHLLSLDAPSVAAIWTWFIARSSHIELPLAAPAAMVLAVWILYAADRLLDAARAPASELEARHLFHHRYRRAFLAGIAIAAAVLAALLPSLSHAAIRLYLIEGTLLFAWFFILHVILHATDSAHRLPKEIAVGLFFSAAVFIPTVARDPALRVALLPPAFLFAISCSLNCLFIYAWEHDLPGIDTAHATTRLALAHLPALAVSAALAGAALACTAAPAAKPIAAACTLAVLNLLALHYTRSQRSRIDQRVSADLALLAPILLLPFLRFGF
ncbi:MAG: hypothetical protein M3O31_17330 [Acidobacteriota bacterium]|nr:hypothetical protein [Acidobacteriota bacterium]